MCDGAPWERVAVHATYFEKETDAGQTTMNSPRRSGAGSALGLIEAQAAADERDARHDYS